MNGTTDRRLRRLEGAQGQGSSDEPRIVILDWPNRADPSAEEIARATCVMRLRFVPARPVGQQ